MQGGASYTHCRCSSARMERTHNSLSTEPLIQPLLSKLLLSTNLSMSLAHFTAFTEVGKATAILFAYNYSTRQRDRLDRIINFLSSIHIYIRVQIYIILYNIGLRNDAICKQQSEETVQPCILSPEQNATQLQPSLLGVSRRDVSGSSLM